MECNVKQYPKSNSGSLQEPFVLNILNEKTNGYYVEIGSGPPIEHSNTYLLETEFMWNGLGLDIKKSKVDSYNKVRRNKAIQADSSQFNFIKYFEENNFPKQIDYLQVDVDSQPDYVTLKTLLNLPLNQYRFSVITFEHGDFENYKNHKVRDISREIFNMYNYQLVVEEFGEDFWVDVTAVDRSEFSKYFAKIIRKNYVMSNEVI